MNSVTATNAEKIAMLIVGLPMVSAGAVAAAISDTGGPLGAGWAGLPSAAGELVGLEPLAHLVGDRVRPLVGMRDVEMGDGERRHELREAQQEADVHVAEHLRGHEVRRVGGEQDVEQVPGEERHRHREGEPAEPPLQLDEFGTVLRRQVLLRRQQSTFFGIAHGTPSSSRNVAFVTVWVTRNLAGPLPESLPDARRTTFPAS